MTTPQERLQQKRGSKPNPIDAINERNKAYQAEHNTTTPEVQEGEVVVRLHVTKIRPNPYQHRTVIDQAGIADLAHSIRVNGQNQPIGVRKRGDSYEIIFGERRWRAAQTLDDKMVDVVIREVSDKEMNYICLSENRDRKKAYDYETYRGINFALEDNETPDEIMTRLGIDKPAWYKYVSFGSLHPQVKDFIHENPACVQRNDSYQLVGIFKNFGEKVPSGAVEHLLELMQMYLDKKLSSRGEIGKRFSAKFAEKKSRNREKKNQDFSVSIGAVKVGSMVRTPEEIRLVLQKSELPKDKLDELDKLLEAFFKISQVETATA